MSDNFGPLSSSRVSAARGSSVFMTCMAAEGGDSRRKLSVLA